MAEAQLANGSTNEPECELRQITEQDDAGRRYRPSVEPEYMEQLVSSLCQAPVVLGLWHITRTLQLCALHAVHQAEC